MPRSSQLGASSTAPGSTIARAMAMLAGEMTRCPRLGQLAEQAVAEVEHRAPATSGRRRPRPGAVGHRDGVESRRRRLTGVVAVVAAGHGEQGEGEQDDDVRRIVRTLRREPMVDRNPLGILT